MFQLLLQIALFRLMSHKAGKKQLKDKPENLNSLGFTTLTEIRIYTRRR
jgi:hypothetical protein